MNQVWSPTAAIHRRAVSATNAGPLSDRVYAGMPRRMNGSVSMSMTSVDDRYRRTPDHAVPKYTVRASDRNADGVFVQPDPDNDTVVFLGAGASVRSRPRTGPPC